MNTEQLMTLQEVASMLKVDEQLVYRFIREGKLRATKVSRFWRIKQSDIERAFGLEEMSNEPSRD